MPQQPAIQPPHPNIGGHKVAIRLGAFALLACAAVLSACAGSGLHTAGPVSLTPEPTAAPPQSLKVLTLNLAHGRGSGRHQVLQGTESIRANLLKTAEVLRRHAPDVVALQEADGPSFWSGSFDHVQYLAQQTHLEHVVHGEHVEGLGLTYGTALMSRLQPTDPVAVTFDPELSPFPKGFVVATLPWPNAPVRTVDVASVHLDFLSKAARREQAAELIATLKQRGNAVIVMGDFNSQGKEPGSVVQLVARELGLTAFSSTGLDLSTFPRFDSRLDWILISRDLEFLAYETLPDSLSDHRGVLAEIVPLEAALAGNRDAAR